MDKKRYPKGDKGGVKMKRLLIATIILLLWASPAMAIEPEKQGFWASRDPWTKQDTYWQLGVLVTQIIDWGQTREIATNPNYYETNKILGEHPTLQEVDRYFIACIAGNYLISKALPNNWRRKWQIGSMLFQTYYINNNYELGIKTNF
jgi:hypothetical protein